MARTLPKEKLLPSLLDRLTDDDPVNRSMKEAEAKIISLENSLSTLKKNAANQSPVEVNRKRRALYDDLDKLRQQYVNLSGAASSLGEIRECVKRDLDWLLNSHNFKPQEDLDDFPEIKSSVLNYGLPDMTGITASSVDLREMEKLIKQALLDYEPRIIRRTLNVKLMAEESMIDHNALTFEIEGELMADPLPIHLHLKTQLELENGDMLIQEFEGRS